MHGAGSVLEPSEEHQRCQMLRPAFFDDQDMSSMRRNAAEELEPSYLPSNNNLNLSGDEESPVRRDVGDGDDGDG